MQLKSNQPKKHTQPHISDETVCFVLPCFSVRAPLVRQHTEEQELCQSPTFLNVI